MIYLIIAVMMLVVATMWYRHQQNPYRCLAIYRCIEGGDSSALYIHKNRYHAFAGGFSVDLFRRITCAPDVEYTSATSDWFNPFCGYSRKLLSHFERVPRQEAQQLLSLQLPVTRKIERQIAKAKRAGTLKPNQGFSAA